MQYNEHKLKQGVAELIHSVNYLKETQHLRFTDKLKTLQKLAALNERTKVNGVHISLNFDPSEKLSKETLSRIADRYMERIGFGHQPYLVYEHKDAGHPHIHIATTNVQKDGSRISLHNIGKNQSEEARLAIEKEFYLVKAQRSQIQHKLELKALKIEYGRSEMKRAMSNILNAVIPHYKYTSLPELNAVLRQYRLVADRGSEESRIYKNNGLVYRALNEKGEKVGVPIKASDFHFNPGLKLLQEKFAVNERLRQPYKQRIKNAIDFSLLKFQGKGLTPLIRDLQKHQISVVLRQNDKGMIYGITYVDHQCKCVFNGSDLGKPYSATGLQQRCSIPLTISNEHQQVLKISSLQEEKENAISAYIGNILQPETEHHSLAPELKQNLSKRKRKRLHHK